MNTTKHPAPAVVQKTGRVGTLVFHVGDPKTGSTSIQRVLFENTWSAPGHRIAYPDTLNALPMAKALEKGGKGNNPAPLFRRTAAWLDQQEADIAVISAEHFAGVAPETLKDAIDKFLPAYADRVQVIAYARPHISRLVSSYTQRVKARGLQQDFDSFCTAAINNDRFQFAPRFLKWRAVFGAAFTLRPMIRDHLFRGDVVADFLHQTLKSDTFEIDQDGQANAAPTLDHLSCLREAHAALKQAGVDTNIRQALGRALAERLTAPPLSDGLKVNGPKLKMSASQLPALQAAYAKDAAALDAAFFDGSPMTEALKPSTDSTTDAPQPLAASDRFDPARLQALNKKISDLAAVLSADPEKWKRQFVQNKRRKTGPKNGATDMIDEINLLIDNLRHILA